jgi:oligopeptide transport system permease protein
MPAPVAVEPEVVGTSLWKDAWRRLRRNRLAMFGLVVVIFITLASVIGPPIIHGLTGFTYDYIPSDSSLIKSFPPFTSPNGSFSWTHPMGTDIAGRDILARVLLGGRISLEAVREAIERVLAGGPSEPPIPPEPLERGPHAPLGVG